MTQQQKATFGMGCFWHVELLFSKIKGVVKTEVGYMGGDENRFTNPSYEEVCTDKTNYAEVVQITFNPKKTDYTSLLDLFWRNHNPTTLNRQGLDVGKQYRSVIFYHDEEQKKKALASKDKYQKQFGNKIVTQIIPAKTFFKAEEYHQKYLEKQGRNVC